MKCGTIPVARETRTINGISGGPSRLIEANYRRPAEQTFHLLSAKFLSNLKWISFKVHSGCVRNSALFIQTSIWCDTISQWTGITWRVPLEIKVCVQPFTVWCDVAQCFSSKKKRETFSVQTDWLWPLFRRLLFPRAAGNSRPPDWVTLRQLEGTKPIKFDKN